MTRRSWLLAAVLATACVPSTEDLDPHGAAGFTVEPSAATRGEPFTTEDGYVVTIDTFVLLASINAFPVQVEGVETYGSGGGDYFLFSGNSRETLWVPGVAVGRTELNVSLDGFFLDPGYVPEPPVTAPGAGGFLPRFLRGAEIRPVFEEYDGPIEDELVVGPGALVAFRAEGAGRVYRADVTLARSGFTPVEFPNVEVTANALVTTPLYVRAEALFARAACTPPFCSRITDDEETTQEFAAGPPLFGPFAAADEDGDGILTSEELSQVRDEEGSLFADELMGRLDVVFAGTP